MNKSEMFKLAHKATKIKKMKYADINYRVQFGLELKNLLNTPRQNTATKKQVELLKDMYRVLYTEMEFGTIGKLKNYSVKQASVLIKMNKDNYYASIDDGFCTVRQYEELKKIAGRDLKMTRSSIGYSTAVMWINKYKMEDKD